LEAIAVGGIAFAERIKSELGIKRKERKGVKSFVGKFVGCCPHDLEALRLSVTLR